MFTEYQVRAALISTLEYALEHFDLGEDYTVMARNPQNMVYQDDAVILDLIGTKRQGFQGHVHRVIDDKLVEFDQWIEEQTWQVSIVHKRKIDDDIDTLTGNDVAKMVKGWLNSRAGAAYMRGREDVPFAPVFTSEIRTQVYEDDSDIRQKDEQFDFRIIVLQVIDDTIHDINGFVVETHPV